jgi:hypothetical protein
MTSLGFSLFMYMSYSNVGLDQPENLPLDDLGEEVLVYGPEVPEGWVYRGPDAVEYYQSLASALAGGAGSALASQVLSRGMSEVGSAIAEGTEPWGIWSQGPGQDFSGASQGTM